MPSRCISYIYLSILKMTEGVDDMINKAATKVVTTRPCTVVVHDIEQCIN